MASGFDVTIKIVGQEDVSRASARAEQALGRLGDRGSRALQRIGSVASSIKQSLEALGQATSLGAVASAAQQIAQALAGEQAALVRLAPVLADHADQSRATAAAQRTMAASINQAAAAFDRSAASAERAAAALRRADEAAFFLGSGTRRSALLRRPSRSVDESIARFEALFAQHGAILDRPTFLVGGEAGRELVVPERRSQRSPEVQREFERLAAAESASGGSGGEVTIVVPVSLDGRRIAKVVARHHRRGVL